MDTPNPTVIVNEIAERVTTLLTVMNTPAKINTREQWLEAAVAKLTPLFVGAGYTVPKLRVSIGFPSRGGLSRRRLTVGQCWDKAASADGETFSIFISPLLEKPSDIQGVLATLTHEILHAVLGTDAGHGPKFAKGMKLLGLEGKATASVAGEALAAHFEDLVKDLGEFPHTRLDPRYSGQKKQSTRLIKCECPDCGYNFRVTRQWIDKGLPTCVCGAAFKPVLPKGEEGGE